jgi:hypothetical protein
MTNEQLHSLSFYQTGSKLPHIERVEQFLHDVFPPADREEHNTPWEQLLPRRLARTTGDHLLVVFTRAVIRGDHKSIIRIAEAVKSTEPRVNIAGGKLSIRPAKPEVGVVWLAQKTSGSVAVSAADIQKEAIRQGFRLSKTKCIALMRELGMPRAKAGRTKGKSNGKPRKIRNN